ncbi:hypothetical protein WDW89_08240 [Deltaproteobacteria bacterium TL4]
MIPPKSNNKWKLLVSGKVAYTFNFFPASMLISRLIRKTQKDQSEATSIECIEEIHTFFVKYESTLTEDIKAIFK